jgi:plastocyanin
VSRAWPGGGRRRQSIARPLLGALLLAGSVAADPPPGEVLPGPEQAAMVTVARTGPAAHEITVLAEAVAVKESGPAATLGAFGEVYAWAPSFLAVTLDQPVRISFWNLQPDDEHDFQLQDPRGGALMHVLLPPLTKTSFVFTFHRTGIFPFLCLLHQPEMSGQILVVAPEHE